MKRKILAAGVLLSLTVFFAAGCNKGEDAKTDSSKKGEAAYHIGMMTGTVSQSEDDLRGAEELIKLYGSAKDGGMIQHMT